MNKIWFDGAWEEYHYWLLKDKKTFNKINDIIKDLYTG